MINNTKNPGLSSRSLIPLSELQRAPGKLVKRLKSTAEPFLILDRGRPVAFLVKREHYENLLATAQETLAATEKRRRELLGALEKMLPVIIKEYRPEKIILFGSLATGDVVDTSDIDLVIVKKTKKRPIDRQKEILRAVHPEVSCDFFIYTPEEFERGLKEKKGFFKQEILEKGKILYDKAT